MSFARTLDYHRNRFHEKQEQAWLGYKAGRDLVLPWGRRSGKSDLFSEILIEDVETSGYQSLFIAKTKIQAREIIWDKFKNRLKHERGWKLQDSKMEACFKGGPVIRIKGADKDMDTLTGSGYRIIACDEFALWKNPEIVGKILAPMLGDYNGQFLFGSTKRGKNHFYKLAEKAKLNPEKYFTNECTIFENPYMSDEGRAKVLSEYAGVDDPLYRQEILNQYVVFEGMVFALSEDTYTEKRWDEADLEHSYHWRGMDHGFSPDPTACNWIAYNRKKGYFQLYSEYKEKKLLVSQHADAIRGQERFPIVDTLSDIDPQLMAEYEAVGLSLTGAGKHDKQARIVRLVNALRMGKIKIAHNCRQLLSEMQSYTWEDVEKGNGEDHLIDAFNYGFNNLVLPEVEEPQPDNRFTRRSSIKQESYTHQDFGDE